jgi:hypothetical protein
MIIARTFGLFSLMVKQVRHDQRHNQGRNCSKCEKNPEKGDRINEVPESGRLFALIACGFFKLDVYSFFGTSL